MNNKFLFMEYTNQLPFLWMEGHSYFQAPNKPCYW